MNAPVLWVIFPALLSLFLLAAHYHPRVTYWIGSSLVVLLALLAWLLPMTPGSRLGPIPLYLNPTMTFLGRTLTLDAGDRPFLMLVYSLAGMWFIGSRIGRANQLFIPAGLGMVAFLVAAVAVEPFLYAALFIEIAVLISIPLLSPPGQKIYPGILRYLIFQTLGMPFILFTGWMLTGVESGSAAPELTSRAGMLLALGFAFLLAVFPFYTWIPLLTEKAQPYVAGFVLSVLPTVVLLFGLNFLDRYAWIRDSANLYVGLRLIGALMVVTGGLWAAFQNHLGRMFGYGVIVETGFSLLAISLTRQGGLALFALLLLPRLLGFAVWTLCLAIAEHETGSLKLDQLRGFGRYFPMVTAGLVASHLSIAGLPLLADFPVKQALLNGIAQQSGTEAYWILAGSFGLMVAALRSLAVFLQSQEAPVEEIQPVEEVVLVLLDSGLEPATAPSPEAAAVPRIQAFQAQETTAEMVLVGIGILVLVIAGIFPHLFQPSVLNILKPFTHLPIP
ncbi:MAG TPA: proton-conducting transporter membrane subunit [Anaerolineaceae bacterium]|nr:proton-conducting transporter membrane subunit [Anaerolineaceae bacterium]